MNAAVPSQQSAFDLRDDRHAIGDSHSPWSEQTPLPATQLEDRLELDCIAFRRVMGQFATGVVVVTGGVDGVVGMACNSFSSVSLDPPLVLFCPAKTSTTWPEIRQHEHFAVNILAHGHEPIARQFAASGVDRFEGVGWDRGRYGCPILHDAIAWMECSIVQATPVGDHLIVIGRVLTLDSKPGLNPLVFFGGGYRGLAE